MSLRVQLKRDPVLDFIAMKKSEGLTCFACGSAAVIIDTEPSFEANVQAFINIAEGCGRNDLFEEQEQSLDRNRKPCPECLEDLTQVLDLHQEIQKMWSYIKQVLDNVGMRKQSQELRKENQEMQKALKAGNEDSTNCFEIGSEEEECVTTDGMNNFPQPFIVKVETLQEEEEAIMPDLIPITPISPDEEERSIIIPVQNSPKRGCRVKKMTKKAMAAKLSPIMAVEGSECVKKETKKAAMATEVSPTVLVEGSEYCTPIVNGPSKKKWKWQCLHCPVILSRKLRAKEHYDRVHLKQRPHQCSTCGQSFFLQKELRLHFLSVHKGQHYVHRPRSQRGRQKCPLCPTSFATPYSLKGHVKKIHPEYLLDDS